MDAANTPSLADQRNYFDFRQRVPRMTIRGVEVVRSRAMARLPFCDNDLVEFSLRVPPGLRYNRRLVKDAFVREFPHLAQIPITETGYPMMVCSRDVLMHASRVIRYGLRKRGLGWLLSSERRTYQNYGEWFRTNLRGWMEGIILSERAMDRGYFNPEYVRNMVSEHIGGGNHTVSLGALLSLELWHREFID
jgi:asparagine synthase (glutamine-hydrolysing)